jgi:hypothetical protein
MPVYGKVSAVCTAKVALIVWFALTFEKVYEVTAPIDEPSTVTLAIE